MDTLHRLPTTLKFARLYRHTEPGDLPPAASINAAHQAHEGHKTAQAPRRANGPNRPASNTLPDLFASQVPGQTGPR